MYLHLLMRLFAFPTVKSFAFLLSSSDARTCLKVSVVILQRT
jgi:hypothetical protein